ncbi:unnamed protein product [Linum trigynum]|uniref:Uncharacterized protein n=1 Tax=Linum trigynum TaxID=586398 RepID=A0AAV2E194_9ROSI
MHLGSLIATSFAPWYGAEQGGHYASEGWSPSQVETLYHQKLVLQGKRGVEYLDGLRAAAAPAPVEPNLEVPPAAEQPPARAPGRRCRPALPLPA